MNAITAEQPISNQSFFKLPLIFITVFFIIYFAGTQGILFFASNLPLDFLLKNLVYGVLSLLLSLFLFFVTAVFCCQKYRLHSVSDSWLKVMLIAIIFSLLYFAWGILIGFFHGFLISSLLSRSMPVSEVSFWITIIFLFMRVVFSILFIFILIFLFYLFAKKDVSSRARFKLEGVKGSRIYSHIYSFLMLFLSIVTISCWLSNSLRSISMSLNVDNFDIIALLTIFIILFIYYIIFYFSTRNRFKRIEPTAKLGKLIVTVIITYLFLLLSSVVIGGVLLIFAWQYLMSGYYMTGSLMLMPALALFIVGSVINLLLYFVLSRLSVKIMYS